MTKSIVIPLVVGILSFCAGILYGFDSGIKNYAALESILTGHISTGYAKKLTSPNEDNIDATKGYLEFQIDNGLDSYIWYKESGNKLLSKISLSEHLEQYEVSVIQLAKYRANNPETDISKFLEKESAIKSYKETLHKRKSLIKQLAGAE